MIIRNVGANFDALLNTVRLHVQRVQPQKWVTIGLVSLLCLQHIYYNSLEPPVPIINTFTITQRPLITSDCKRTQTYVPSAWEQWWVDHMSEVQSDDWIEACDQMRAKKDYAYTAVDFAQSTLQESTLEEAGKWSKDVQSYFRVTYKCPGKPDVEEEHPIEPLVSFLRNPVHWCIQEDWDLRLDKNYLVLDYAPTVQRGGRNFLFDAGASSYTAGPGGASQEWFVEQYRVHGIEFDHIWGWEASGQQIDLMQDTPADILVKSSFFAIPVTPEVGSLHNPLQYIKANCREEDFVVFKLDIDTPAVETALAWQLLDADIAHLIDEFYFEDHVSGSPMCFMGWTWGWKDHDLATSIKYFQDLRKLGIRAHSWV